MAVLSRTILLLVIALGFNIFPVSAAFKLAAETVDQKYAPSNIGIIGLRYLHKMGEMSTVIQIYPGTPAAKSGILVGDRIMEIDGTPIVTFDAEQVYAMIAGRPNTYVSMKMLRCTRNYGTHMGCSDYQVSLKRMEMTNIASDNIYDIYKYNN